MDYAQAKRIRQKGFLGLLTEKLSERNQGVFKSLRETMSERSSARWTGIKEKFDPMNMVRFAFGGSNLAAAMYGRMMGRSQRDIEYFSKGKRPAMHYTRTATKIPSIIPTQTTTSESGISTTSNRLLASMLRVMEYNRADDIKFRETERSFQEERDNEEQRRHDELVKAVRLYGGAGTATRMTSQDGETNLFDILREWWNKIPSLVGDMLKTAFKAWEWLSGLKWLTTIGGWAKDLLAFVGWKEMFTAVAQSLPALGFLAPWMAAAGEREKIRQNPNAPEYKDNAYAMVLRGEAKSEGEGAAILQNRSLKQVPRNTVKMFVDDKSRTDEELRQDLGADRSTLEKWLRDNPNPASMWQAPTAAISGTNRGATQAGAVIPVDKTYQERTAKEARATFAKTDPRMSLVGTKLSDSIEENNTLKMEEDMRVVEPPPPIINQSSNANEIEDRPVGTVASQRDHVDILDRVLGQSRVMV